MWKRKDDCRWGNFFASKLVKNINLDKHFCFRFGTIVITFCLQVWKVLADSKKTRRVSKEEIKKQLLDSMIIDEVVDFEDLNKEAAEYI